MSARLRAPFPWFGGKSRVAGIVWDRFGDVRNYVEPFAGSLAVLLGRPTQAKIETVNDLDCWIANFWRALQADPEALAHHADWPVNEADLHARHLWLVKQTEFRERMKTDATYFDAKIAGWWVWGISQWIGSGWCASRGSTLQKKLGSADGTPYRVRPNLRQGQGVQSLITLGRGAAGKSSPRGVHRNVSAAIRPAFNQTSGLGSRAPDKRPYRSMPHIAGREWGIRSEAGMEAREGGIYDWFDMLAARLRRVRVCCGDWKRILGPAPTTCIGVTGVFLDPPYSIEDRTEVYGEESRDVAHSVREWALANGDNPELRIALCGYEGEHQMPDSWECVAWKANGGFANQKRAGTRGQVNSHRERIWFSPACLRQARLFSEASA